jgi:hypothetical protein
MLTIELILSTSHQPVAPLALIKRELPRMYPATASGGFDYRRRRGIGGSYLDRTALDRSGATALSELLSGLPNVVLEGDPSRRSISFMLPSTGTFATCKPMYFLNGELEREPDSRIAPLPIHAVGAVEVYALASDIPYVYRIGSTGCGMIGVWTADRVK